MNAETGYIQFGLDWLRAAPPSHPVVAELIRWRAALHERGLIGVTDEGLGFGNISCRIAGTARFIVSGTNTGATAAAAPDHFTEIVAYDIDANRVTCRGPVAPSAESLSHAAVYTARAGAGAVIHIHDAGLWQRGYDRVPTTDPAAGPGTAALARAIVRLIESDARIGNAGLIVLGGHPDGLISFGPDLASAAACLAQLQEGSGEG